MSFLEKNRPSEENVLQRALQMACNYDQDLICLYYLKAKEELWENFYQEVRDWEERGC